MHEVYSPNCCFLMVLDRATYKPYYLQAFAYQIWVTWKSFEKWASICGGGEEQDGIDLLVVKTQNTWKRVSVQNWLQKVVSFLNWSFVGFAILEELLLT